MRPQLETALGACFDAVTTPELWPAATEGLTDALGVLGSCFHLRGEQPEGRLQAPMSRRYRDMLEGFLAGGWAEQDLRAQRGWPRIDRGQNVILERHMSTPQERATLPIYQELFRPHDMEVMAGVGFRAGGRQWVLNVIRSERTGDFTPAEAAELEAIGPHLARLADFGEAMARAAAGGALAALEDSATAAVLVDWSGRVVEVNAHGRRIVGAGLRVVKGRLVADWPGAQVQLDRIIAAALSADGASLGAPELAAVPVPGGGVILVDAVAVRRGLADAFGRPGALLMLTDPSRRARPSRASLRLAYGLTARESDVAAGLAAGDNAEEIGADLGLRASSVSQVIKTLLWKTGARRQSELVAMLVRLPKVR